MGPPPGIDPITHRTWNGRMGCESCGYSLYHSAGCDNGVVVHVKRTLIIDNRTLEDLYSFHSTLVISNQDYRVLCK